MNSHAYSVDPLAAAAISR